MIASLIGLLIILLVIGAIWLAVSTLIPLPHPIGVIVQLILVLIAVLVIIDWLLPLAGLHGYGLRLAC